MKFSWLKDTDFIWCPGCPVSWLALTLAKFFEEKNFKQENFWLVSGIGCAGRIANYFNGSTAHTTHGRAIPVAEGIKLAQPESDVFVVSGDGDLLSIGLGHLIHSARRGIPLKVICVNNDTYAMTGGQTSPTTPQGLATKTHLAGVPYPPIEPRLIMPTISGTFFARAIAYNGKSFLDVLGKAYEYPGFAFIELVSFCLINDPRFKDPKNLSQDIKNFSNKFKSVGLKKNLGVWELGYWKNKNE